jgi:hypothetical protein
MHHHHQGEGRKNMPAEPQPPPEVTAALKHLDEVSKASGFYTYRTITGETLPCTYEFWWQAHWYRHGARDYLGQLQRLATAPGITARDLARMIRHMLRKVTPSE